MLQAYPWKLNLKAQRYLLLLLGIGLLVIGCIDMLIMQKFKADQAYSQSLVAQQLQAKIQSSLKEHVTALIALNVVYQNFVDINHYDFQQYGHSITTNLKGFRRLLYIDPSLTIRRIYPLTAENTKLYGVSLQKNSQYTRFFNEAKAAREPTTSALITFMQHPKSILAVIPIYRSNAEFLGYAAGEISIEEIWKPLNTAIILKQYQVQLLDPAGHALFQNVQLEKRDRIMTEAQFLLADRQWTLLLVPVKPTFERLIVQRTVLWSLGLVFLLLIHLIISGSKQYKINLGQAQRQFETIFKASPDGILMLSDTLQLQLTNPPIQAWSGLAEAELSSKTFFDLFTCQCPHLNKCKELSFLLCTSEQFEESLPEILETQTTHAANGLTRTLRLNASRIQPDLRSKRPGGFICTLGDISAIKELQQVKETYIATLTHDLKTPLLGQEMVLETLLSGRAGTVSTEQRKLLHGAMTSVHDLLEMVNATVLYYKLESDHLPLHRQPIAVDALMKEVLEGLRPLLDKRQLTVEMQTAVNLPQAWIDALQMKRVFHNLLSNAISYARRESCIRVDLQTDPSHRLVVGIQNEGKGIAPSELPKIFEKYYSLSRRFKQVGTGLGLYISRRIVELHGGRIWVESEPEKTTRFFVSLPYPQPV